MIKSRIVLIIILLKICGNLKSQPTIGFLDAFKDETLSQARQGFFDALSKNGFSEKNNTLKVIYRNAQGDIPTLSQACQYFISENVDLIATCPSLSTITAVQATKDIPVCMIVSPSPELSGLVNSKGDAPKNLFGVYETLDYIDTAVSLILKTNPFVKKLGLLYNQSEPQSQSAFEHIKTTCSSLNIELIALPANNSSETQQVVQTLISKNIDAFFAMPDNTVFASFEVILKECKKNKVPIYTSEAGLFARGADAAFGADIYQWGFQAGLQAATYLSTKILPLPEIVQSRKKLIRNSISVKRSFTYNATNYYLTALLLALTFSGLCLGLFISINVFNLPDITTDGSFTLGAAITSTMLYNNYNIWITLLFVLVSGALAGITTGLIHTKLKVNALLSGIITMTALYSINLLIMGRSNIPLINTLNIFSYFNNQLIILLIMSICLVLLLNWLLKTDFGIAMRATGNSENMVKALGINPNKMKIIGLAIANSLTAFSGFLITQYQGFADINMGIGIVIFGLGSVMISNALLDLLNQKKIIFRLFGVIIGAIIFRVILALALNIGLDPVLLKLVTAFIVLMVVSIPAFKKGGAINS